MTGVTGRPRRIDLGLTPREREVLAWLVRGLSRAEIARRLGTRPETVKHQQAAVYRKLGVSGRFAAAARVWADGAGGAEARRT